MWCCLENFCLTKHTDLAMNAPENPRPPLPPFTRETAVQKVRMAEDAWNARDPQRVSLAYSPDSVWRNRSEFFAGRPAIVEFLTRKWAAENEYRLIKELWAFTDNRIAVRFACESQTTRATGFAPTATRTGSLTRWATCAAASPASTICRSRPRLASFTGRWVVARTTTCD